jgi:large subunit ribosomal protein L25
LGAGALGQGGALSTHREDAFRHSHGDRKEPEASPSVSRDTQPLHGPFQGTIFTLDVEGKKTRVIPRSVQLDPIRDSRIHVDFMRVSGMRSSMSVPVRFLNELASGLRGGVLNVVRHEIAVRCPADAIPDHFEVDLTGLEIGDSVHISAIALPEGVRTITTERDFTVATIVGRSAEEVPTGPAVTEAAAPGAEGAAGTAEGGEDKDKAKEKEKPEKKK